MHIINIFDGYSDDDFTIFVLLNKDFFVINQFKIEYTSHGNTLPIHSGVIFSMNIYWTLNWGGFSHAKNANHIYDVG